MAHNPECGLDCVSAGAVRGQPADANQQTGRQHLSGDQSAEQATYAPRAWEYVEGEFNHDEPNSGQCGSIVGDVGGGRNYDSWFIATIENAPYHIQSARLIAAAPEMLEALKAIVTWAEELGYFADEGTKLAPVFQRGREVLAKAEGRDR